MKIKFESLKEQDDAVRAVCDVFAGQPFFENNLYLMDIGRDRDGAINIFDYDNNAFSNAKLVSSMNDKVVLDNIKRIQQNNNLERSEKIERRSASDGYNISIEMETGTGKTFTYIKTMFELNKLYGWSKFIIVVPSVAIREGVNKSFQMTEEYFLEEYQKRASYFIYNSKQLNQIDTFARDNNINVMIINSQAFNADDTNINKKLDSFRSRRPIDVISKTNPILIIDEPQSVEGAATIQKLKVFNPLFTLRYSATHKKDNIFNMVYRLDAFDAFEKKLVKKISVLGIEEHGTNATNSYIYLKSINVSDDANPTATLEIDYKGKASTKKKLITVKEGFNLFQLSNELEEYNNNYVVKKIDARGEGTISFLNGLELKTGEVIGSNTEEQLRRIQIRETINAHINRERELYRRGIKVLSLFFIDEVSNFKSYEGSTEVKGIYAKTFEEEYDEKVKMFLEEFDKDCKEKDISAKEHIDYAYVNYLKEVGNAINTYTGYFSIDKKGHIIKSHVGRKETVSDDVDAYTLIMKDKERLIDINPKNSPWRFIFSHSALKEGWDNTNVFQICTLKEGQSVTRRRQEIGRGLRICVNKEGERQDKYRLDREFFDVNELTVIASESYESFVKNLQTEISDALSDRPVEVNAELFIGRVIHDKDGNEITIDKTLANKINHTLIMNHYIDDDNSLSDVYYEEKDENKLVLSEELEQYKDDIVRILDNVYNPDKLNIANARDYVELKLDKAKFDSKEFKELWNKINHKSTFKVSFESDELIEKAVKSINEKLNVTKVYFKLKKGKQKEDAEIKDLKKGTSFESELNATDNVETMDVSSFVKYDLIGKIAEKTILTRKDVGAILTKISKEKFNMFKLNPEEFILRISILINEAKATTVIEHIEYNKSVETYGTDIFTDYTIKGQLGKNLIKTNKHLYDNLVYDSTNEKNFATEIDSNKDVKLYVKLPGGFYINTPVGTYNPDWAISYEEDGKTHVYFVAETKGDMETLELSLRGIEQIKTKCAKKHFKAICGDDVQYGIVDSVDGLLELLKK